MRTILTLPETSSKIFVVGMKPLSERDENCYFPENSSYDGECVGMKPLSERDENRFLPLLLFGKIYRRRNEATL